MVWVVVFFCPKMLFFYKRTICGVAPPLPARSPALFWPLTFCGDNPIETENYSHLG